MKPFEEAYKEYKKATPMKTEEALNYINSLAIIIKDNNLGGLLKNSSPSSFLGLASACEVVYNEIYKIRTDTIPITFEKLYDKLVLLHKKLNKSLCINDAIAQIKQLIDLIPKNEPGKDIIEYFNYQTAKNYFRMCYDELKQQSFLAEADEIVDLFDHIEILAIGGVKY